MQRAFPLDRRRRNRIEQPAIAGGPRLRIAVRQTTVFPGADDPLGTPRRAGLLRFQEAFVDVGFAVGDADDLGLRQLLGQRAGQPIALQPTEAFFFLNRFVLALLSLAKGFVVAGPKVHPHDAQAQSLRRKRHMHVVQKTPAALIVQGPSTLHRAYLPRVLQLRGVLRHQDDRMGFHPLDRRLTVRRKHLALVNLLVLEKLVGGMGFRPTVAGSVDARLRIGGQPLQNPSAPPIQTFVSQIDSGQFVLNPFCGVRGEHTVPHCGPPCFGPHLGLLPASLLSFLRSVWER